MGILSVKGADGKRYPYILIGIIEKQRSAQNYTSWIRSRSEIIRNVSAIVYKGVIAQHKRCLRLFNSPPSAGMTDC